MASPNMATVLADRSSENFEYHLVISICADLTGDDVISVLPQMEAALLGRNRNPRRLRSPGGASI